MSCAVLKLGNQPRQLSERIIKMDTDISKLLQERVYLAGAGTETYLIFQQGFELPEFCAFLVHENEEAWKTLAQNLIEPILQTAANHGYGVLLDALVWRAHRDFLGKVGHRADELEKINARAVRLTREVVDRWRQEHGHDAISLPALIVGDIGPRGDGYQVQDADVTSDAARKYHTDQIQALAAADVDLICALTMTTVAESIGIVQASSACGLPVMVSPTVETDGRLPDGVSLGDFVDHVDDATDGAPLIYMVNCAHPNHLLPTLEAARTEDATWLSRFRGFRANASTRSHEELDNSTELDRGNVPTLARQMSQMRSEYDLQVIGGCCGTDHEHLQAMAAAAKLTGVR